MPRFTFPEIDRPRNRTLSNENLEKPQSTKTPKVSPYCYVCSKSMPRGGRFLDYTPDRLGVFVQRIKLCGSCSDYFDSRLHDGLGISRTLDSMRSKHRVRK